MNKKQWIIIVTILVIAVVLVIPACAKQASEPPSTVPTPVSTLTPLDKIIEGAKAEGEVNVFADIPYYPEQLRNEIKKMFGVDINIVVTSGVMAEAGTRVRQEFEVGVTPSYDLMHLSNTQIALHGPSGIFEKVDWKSILTKDTNPESIIPTFNTPFTWGYASLLIYNSTKVSAQDVPKSFSELANPKWKGKIGIFTFPNLWATYIHTLGDEKGKQILRDIVKNEAVKDTYLNLQNKLLLGESWMAIMGSQYLYRIKQKDKDFPIASQNLDFVELNEAGTPVLARAKHPNAAKLIVIFLASPAGAKFSQEVLGYGNYLYQGSNEYEIVTEAKRKGIPILWGSRDTKLVDYQASKEFQDLVKEVNLILKGQ